MSDTENQDTRLCTPPKHQLQNVVATFNIGLGCLNLKRLALDNPFFEYNPKRFAASTIRIKNPKTTALLFASGNMVCTGAKNEQLARFASRKYVRLLQRYNIPASFGNFQVQNIVASASVGAPLKIIELAQDHAAYTSYEPELFPGLVYRHTKPKLVFLLFRSGKIVITGAKTTKDIEATFSSLYRNVIINYIDHKDPNTSSSVYRQKQIQRHHVPKDFE